MNELQNAILITGASQRVGLSLAHQFLDQGQFPVVFTYRTERNAVIELKEKGAVGFQVDFSHKKQLVNFLKRLPQQVASVRTLIHNASLWMPEQNLSETAFRQFFEVHMQAPFEITEAVIPLMRQSNEPMQDIIAISDWKTKTGSADYMRYLATKAGLESLMLSFAQKYAPSIKSNVIAPGLILFNDGDSEDYKQKRLSEMANPSEMGPEAIWTAVQFLMNSDHASGSKIELGHLHTKKI